MAVTIRPLDEQERQSLKALARSRKAPARLVERAQIVWFASQGAPTPEIARRLGIDPRTAETWLCRFNESSLAGLHDRPRSGRPVTYPPEVVGEVIAASLTDPRQLGLPFGCWSVRRLETYLNEHRGISIKRSRLDELLLAEGLRWRTQESWFGEQAEAEFAQPPQEAAARPHPVDPQFARKRG
jgi:transposase